jgi:hypothetical protein
MPGFREGIGSFVARATLTAGKARRLARAGHSLVLFQVDFQGSKLEQRTAAALGAEMAVARAVGLDVGWWQWIRPGNRSGSGRRPGGAEAAGRRVAELAAALGECPALQVANCEVGGGWSRSRPNLRPVAAALRQAGGQIIGLSSHGIVGLAWPVSAFQIGMPQLYRKARVTQAWVQRCLRTWRWCPEIWPTLGAADSTADDMRADLEVLTRAGSGALWWTARQLGGAKLAASVPSHPPEPNHEA